MKVSIVNVVATASLRQAIDFDELVKHKEILHDSNVHGDRVAYFKTPNMQGKISLFSSGKMVSAGTRSERKAILELQAASDFLVTKGLAERVKLDPEIRNVVATVDLERSLSLEKLALKLKAIYEPDQLTGMLLRIEHPVKASILLFASGKAIVTGLKNATQANSVAEELLRVTRMTPI